MTIDSAPSRPSDAWRLFLPFALGYYLSYLLRNANAVLAPELTRELPGFRLATVDWPIHSESRAYWGGAVEYRTGTHTKSHLTEWEHQWELRTGNWAQTDYNFEKPSTSLLTKEPSRELQEFIEEIRIPRGKTVMEGTPTEVWHAYLDQRPTLGAVA